MSPEPRLAHDKPPVGQLQFNNTRGNGVYVVVDRAEVGGTVKTQAPANKTTDIILSEHMPSIHLTFYTTNDQAAQPIGSVRVPATGELSAEDHANGAVAILGNHQNATQDCAVLLFKDDAVVGANCTSVPTS